MDEFAKRFSETWEVRFLTATSNESWRMQINTRGSLEDAIQISKLMLERGIGLAEATAKRRSFSFAFRATLSGPKIQTETLLNNRAELPSNVILKMLTEGGITLHEHCGAPPPGLCQPGVRVMRHSAGELEIYWLVAGVSGGLIQIARKASPPFRAFNSTHN